MHSFPADVGVTRVSLFGRWRETVVVGSVRKIVRVIDQRSPHRNAPRRFVERPGGEWCFGGAHENGSYIRTCPVRLSRDGHG